MARRRKSGGDGETISFLENGTLKSVYDVGVYPRTADGDYFVPSGARFAIWDDADYYDFSRRISVQSLGCSRGRGYVKMADGTYRIFQKGQTFASPRKKFQGNENFICLWLR